LGVKRQGIESRIPLNDTFPAAGRFVSPRFVAVPRNIQKQISRQGITYTYPLTAPTTASASATRLRVTVSPHILVVDDDREISRLAARFLGANGCRVSVAGSGREMDRALEASRLDLIVLDLMLPGEDGLSICRRLRLSSHVPIIMLTAKGEDVDRIIGLEMGADDYLTKPFNPRELLARIKAVLRRAAHSAIAASATDARVLRFLGWRIRTARASPSPAPSSTCCRPSVNGPDAFFRAISCSISPKGAAPAPSSAASTCW
jgi:CheY-like chemotaxis protein